MTSPAIENPACRPTVCKCVISHIFVTHVRAIACSVAGLDHYSLEQPMRQQSKFLQTANIVTFTLQHDIRPIHRKVKFKLMHMTYLRPGEICQP